MAFASAWLREKAIFPEFISDKPDGDTGIIIVIPAYNEPQITITLDSLAKCHKPGCKTEVLVVINAPANAREEHREGNKLTKKNIISWKKQNSECFFRLFYCEPGVDLKDWGVGLARKTGMDEALRRFNEINRPEGVILCLDADCTVAPDYLTEVYKCLYLRKERNACSIYFEHPVNGYSFPENHYRSITLYELHLRYYYQSLRWTGFPYAFQTTGSAMAVKATTYMKAGGMNRKQAGEDFYFIQKLVPAGGYFYLNSTAVYPAPRSSYRVPFGTGASMLKLLKDKEPLFLTYNLDAFIELRTVFTVLSEAFNANQEHLHILYNKMPAGMRMFICEDEWIMRIREIQVNTKGFESFRKRFFGWFNMFRIVKYLNFVHQDLYNKVPVELASADLLSNLGIPAESHESGELLEVFRLLERGF